MNQRDLRKLSKRGLSFLRLTAEEWEKIRETRYSGRRFSLSFPHETAHNGKAQGLAVVAISGEKPTLRIGVVKSIQATATLDSRVVFDLVHEITPRTLSRLFATVEEPPLRAALTKLRERTDSFVAVSPKLGVHLIDALANMERNAPVFQRILASLDRPERYTDARALQVDAVRLALKAFGHVEEATELALSGDSTALATVRLHEDAVIEHDARWMPGWDLDDSDVTGRAEFTHGRDRLEVFTANKRELEKIFGVDLIYLNKKRGALVMLQYKMMEPTERRETDDFQAEPEWTVPIDRQFKDEIGRMEKFNQDLEPRGAYRLNSGAFYFKLVKRLSAAGSAGIILSLDHLTQMMDEGLTRGPKGGLKISYRRLDGHYLRSEPFVELVRSGYIGTRGATTKNLELLIRSALQRDHAVVAAVQSLLRRRRG